MVALILGQDALAEVDLVLVQGSTNRFTFRYLTGEVTPVPVDLRLWEGRAQIRRSFASADAWLDIDAELSQDGYITLLIGYTLTEGEVWDSRDWGVWDLELTSPSDERIRLVRGKVRVSHEVTRDA